MRQNKFLQSSHLVPMLYLTTHLQHLLKIFPEFFHFGADDVLTIGSSAIQPVIILVV